MVSVYALKPGFQSLLRPLVGRCAAWSVTPNQITWLACLLSVGLGADLANGSGRWLLLPLFLLVRMALNAMDGMLARDYGLATPGGAVLNELTDVVADAALTLPFVAVTGPLGAGLAIFFALLAEMAGVVGGGVRRYHGPFGKSDRAVALGAAGTWLALGWPVAHWAPVGLTSAWVLLCAVTIWNRGRTNAG